MKSYRPSICVFHVLIVWAHLFCVVGCHKAQLAASYTVGRYRLRISEHGVSVATDRNVSEEVWWEGFYQYIVNLKASHDGESLQLQQDVQLTSLLKHIVECKRYFYHHEFGRIDYCELGSRDNMLSNVTYMRIVDDQSIAGLKRLDLLIEKGTRSDSVCLPQEISENQRFKNEVRNGGTPWILYRFLVSKMLNAERQLFSTAFLLSCDKWYCVTGIDGTRLLFFARDKERHRDLFSPGTEGHATLEKIFTDAVEAYLASFCSG
jgi:hypothetical protein